MKLIPAKTWADSCDCCASQEGRHYCLLHTKVIKNMDTVRCKDWTDCDTGHGKNDLEN